MEEKENARYGLGFALGMLAGGIITLTVSMLKPTLINMIPLGLIIYFGLPKYYEWGKKLTITIGPDEKFKVKGTGKKL